MGRCVVDAAAVDVSHGEIVMSLPTSYLTSFKNLKEILAAIQGAQAPKKFTVTFLQGLGYKGTADRLIIGYLKALGFLSPSGEPTPRYYAFLDQSQSARVLADAVRDAYADLFQVNTKANELSNTEIKNKLKTLTQGQFSDSVLDKMAGSFKAVSALSDFSTPSRIPPAVAETPELPKDPLPAPRGDGEPSGQPIGLSGLVYNIQLLLPESRDPAVYDVLFRSMREHLFK
jgi:hypothetical protein